MEGSNKGNVSFGIIGAASNVKAYASRAGRHSIGGALLAMVVVAVVFGLWLYL